MADLSEKGQEPVQWTFIWFNLHRNTGRPHRAHQSSGSNDQIIDNNQRTMRAYLESGQIAKGL